MGSKGGDTTTVQKADPWQHQQPYLMGGYDRAWDLLNTAEPRAHTGWSVAPRRGETNQALNMLENRATQGSPVENAMQGYVQNTLQNPAGGGTQDYLSGVMKQAPQYFGGSMGEVPNQALTQSASGQMLNANPYLDDMFNSASRAVTDRFTDTVLPGINATFAGAGGSGSGIHRELAMDASDELGQNLSGLAADIYGNNYARERGMQMNAAGALNQDDLARRGMDQGMFQYQGDLGLGAAGLSNQLTGIQGDIQRGAAALAPTAAQFDYNNIDQLMRSGLMQEDKHQQIIDMQRAKDMFNQQAPWDALSNYTAAIQGTSGAIPGNQTSNVDAQGNPIAGAAGGALTAGALGNAMGGAAGGAVGGPWGMLAGAVLGGLLS